MSDLPPEPGSHAPPPPPPPPPPPASGVPGYGPPGFGTPGAAYPPGYAPGAYGGPQRQHPSGTTVLTLGILGLVLGFGCGLGFILSPIAWAKGARARKEMRTEPGVMWTNSGNVTAGWVLGIIGTVMLILGIILLVLLALVARAAGS